MWLVLYFDSCLSADQGFCPCSSQWSTAALSSNNTCIHFCTECGYLLRTSLQLNAYSDVALSVLVLSNWIQFQQLPSVKSHILYSSDFTVSFQATSRNQMLFKATGRFALLKCLGADGSVSFPTFKFYKCLIVPFSKYFNNACNTGGIKVCCFVLVCIFVALVNG